MAQLAQQVAAFTSKEGIVTMEMHEMGQSLTRLATYERRMAFMMDRLALVVWSPIEKINCAIAKLLLKLNNGYRDINRGNDRVCSRNHEKKAC
jgi:hypothetical protein